MDHRLTLKATVQLVNRLLFVSEHRVVQSCVILYESSDFKRWWAGLCFIHGVYVFCLCVASVCPKQASVRSMYLQYVGLFV